ncbi:MarR family winged helix-turn-helix transcriptional regulator [Aneurinibacillus tyrosinisolvens]|uniref:MarR family winged helix-turn-helix transcriptional regulator n=1 Tax=Aneurinibacillus tyrosinisolvens TaxID=1443435 RepID=UPI00063F7348|nr:MarR family transcriptional regulator [Aneurinibacillus tyrosinisolvens]
MEEQDKVKKRIDIISAISEEITRYINNIDRENCGEIPFKLTPSKFLILKTIYEKGKCMVVDIARKLNFTSGATTLALNTLEKEGLIVRTRDQVDRRVVWLHLSEQGVQITERVMKNRDKFWNTLLKNLEEEEQEQFLLLFQKMVKGLSENEENND